MKSTVGIAAIAFMILALNGPALGQNGWTDGGTVVSLTDPTDKVGIGTGSAIRTAHIQYNNAGAASADGLIIHNYNSTIGSTVNLYFKAHNNNADNRVKGAIFFERTSTFRGGGDMHFAVADDGSAANVVLSDSKMTIQMNTGNVGIGTTSPGPGWKSPKMEQIPGCA